jgi:outer membrane protein assembly factor BamA
LPLRSTSPAVPAADALRAAVVGDAAQLLRAISAAGIRNTSGVAGTGPMAVLARISGSAERPVAEADIEYGPGVLSLPDLPPVTALQLRARIDGSRLEVLQATGDWQGSHASGTGRLPLELLAPYLPAGLASALPKLGEPATVSARVESIGPLVLEPFVARDTLAELDGRMTASADLQAASLTLDDLRGEIRFDQVDLVVAGLAVTQGVPTRIVAEGGVARVAAWEWTGPDSTIRVGGQVRLADREAALLVGGRADLRLLAPMLKGTGVSTLGTVEPRVAVTGPLTNPIVEGELLLEGAELRVDSPRIVATTLNALAVLTPSGLELTRLDGRVNGGTLSGQGSLQYSTQGTAPGRLAASVQGMTLDFPAGLRSELDGEIALAITPQSPGSEARGRLTGTVTIVRSAYREPISTVASLLAAMRTKPAAGPTSTESSILRRLDLDVRLVTDEDVLVRNNVAQAQLGTDLRVIGTAAEPALSGRATLREGGTLTFGRNRYTIDQGTIDFSNPTVIEPVLNVQARTRAGGEDVELTLSGPQNALDVRLSSPSAPELSEADIASLLITGRRLEEIEGDEARVVGEEVLSYLSGDILGAAGRVVGLDAVRFGNVTDVRRDTAAIATAEDPTSRMTFVKSFGDQLEVTLSQSLREGDEQTWIVDYLPIPRLDLRFISDDETLRSYEMRHDVTFGAPPAAARESRATRRALPVSDVVLEGTLAVPESVLRRELRLTAGDTFDPSAWQTDRERLEQILERAGYFEARVASSTAEREDGVAISYRVASGPRTTVRVSGDPLRSSASEAITSAWAQSISDDLLRDEVREIVLLDLAREGYLQADAMVSIAASGDEKTLSVALTQGARTPNRIVRVEAAEEALAEEIRRAFGAGGLRALTERGSPALGQELTAALRTRGYLRGEARVTGPQFEGDTATWVAALMPGTLFRLGAIAIEDGRAPSDDILGELKLPEFAEGAPFTPAALDSARTAVAAAYRRRGYSAPNVAAQTAIDDATGLVSVRFAVEPGRQQVLSGVAIDGNRGVRSDVITRALRLQVGEPLATDAWLEARTRLFQTGLFRRVDVAAEATAGAPAGDTVPMTARVTVQEWPALRVRYGLQLSEEWEDGDPLNGRNLTPGVSADATRRTLFGRAITIGAAASLRSRERITRVFASAPTFLGRAMESSIVLQQAHTELPGELPFIRDVGGLSWEQRARVTPRVELSYSYRYERNHTFDPNPPLDPLFPVFDITETVARLVGTATYDSRNDPLESVRGTLLSSDFEYAPESLGSTSGVRFVRSLSQFYHFLPWRNVVFASAVRVGLAAGLGGVDLIPSEKFRAGGSRSVRGVEEDGLGPRSPIFGDPIGGNALLLLNQEMRFPLYRWVRGVLFADLGNVFARPSDVALGDLVGSSGFGVRVAIPFGLIRLDFGRPWSEGDGRQSGGRWSLGIGHAF